MPHGFPEDEAGLSVAPNYKPAIICGCCRTSPPYDTAVTETANRSAFGLPVPATGSGPAATDHVSEKSQDRNLKEYDDLTRNRLMILPDPGYSCRGLFRPGEWVRAEKISKYMRTDITGRNIQPLRVSDRMRTGTGFPGRIVPLRERCPFPHQTVYRGRKAEKRSVCAQR